MGTNVNGQYYITNLEPGDYEIEAFAPGFNTEVQNVRLLVGDQLTVNFQLHPGSVNERVLVSGQTSGINTSEFAVNGSVSQVQIQNLPLNGRNFLELARLEPGVSVRVGSKSRHLRQQLFACLHSGGSVPADPGFGRWGHSE